MEQPQLGLKITALRKQKGLTQEELVEQCNINVRTLQRIESGEVSPRTYTIKMILSALDYDYESLQESRRQSRTEIALIPPKEAKSIHSLLSMAWIAGVLFLVVAVFEGITDYVRVDDGEFIFGIWGHITIKALVILFNGLLLFGFLIAGNVLKNHLMKISSLLFLFALLCFYAFDIASVFSTTMEIEFIFLAGAIGFGAVGIVFGIAVLKSRQLLGTLGLVSGIMELLMAVCLLTVFLSPLSLILLIPVIILEVLVLYKVASLVKEQM